MKKITILLIIFITISVGFFSGCSGIVGEEKPNCYVTRVTGAWSSEYNAFFVDVFVHNNGGKGNVHIGCEITQDGQTFNYFGLQTVCAGCDTSEHIRCGDIMKNGSQAHYSGWVRLAE